MTDITEQLEEALEKLMPWTVSDFSAIPAYRKAESVLAAYRAQPRPVVAEDVQVRITNHLDSGGIFNPKLMDYEKIDDLLKDARALIERLSREKAEAIRAYLEAEIAEGRISINEDSPCDQNNLPTDRKSVV